MPVYAVFEPPVRGHDRTRHAERVTFVRDGFTWSAFLFGPLWMLWHRLWLAFVLYVVIFVLLGWAEYARVIPAGSETVVVVLLALLIGLEAVTLRRRKLLWWRWRDAGVVIAEDLQAAEHRFFDRWAPARAGVSATPAPSTAQAGPGAGIAPALGDRW